MNENELYDYLVIIHLDFLAFVRPLSVLEWVWNCIELASDYRTFERTARGDGQQEEPMTSTVAFSLWRRPQCESAEL